VFLGLLHDRAPESSGRRDGTPIKTDPCNTAGTRITRVAWRPGLSHPTISPGEMWLPHREALQKKALEERRPQNLQPNEAAEHEWPSTSTQGLRQLGTHRRKCYREQDICRQQSHLIFCRFSRDDPFRAPREFTRGAVSGTKALVFLTVRTFWCSAWLAGLQRAFHHMPSACSDHTPLTP